jgi:hypothetical protein
VARRLRFKTKQYFSTDEYASDRTKMVRDGWVIANKRMLPGKIPGALWAPGGEASLLGAALVIAVLGLVFWLINKTQPEEIMVVDYVKDA